MSQCDLPYIAHIPRIVKYINSIKPDLVHAHYVSSYGVVGSFLQYHPFIISVWGKDIYDATNNIILKSLIKRALNKCDYIMSTSATMAKHTRKYTINRNLRITPFGIDIQQFRPLKKQKRDKFIIGTARILAPKYGIHYLIKAFALFTKQMPNSELHIAGDGPQKNELIMLTKALGISHKVTFFGFVERIKIPEFISNLDIFCMPSVDQSESFGVAALEAQACGIPVIASAIGGLLETIIDNKTGFLIPPANIHAIVKKMHYLYNSKEVRRAIGRAGRQFVSKHYNWNDNILLIEEIYHRLV